MLAHHVTLRRVSSNFQAERLVYQNALLQIIRRQSLPLGEPGVCPALPVGVWPLPRAVCRLEERPGSEIVPCQQ